MQSLISSFKQANEKKNGRNNWSEKKTFFFLSGTISVFGCLQPLEQRVRKSELDLLRKLCGGQYYVYVKSAKWWIFWSTTDWQWEAATLCITDQLDDRWLLIGVAKIHAIASCIELLLHFTRFVSPLFFDIPSFVNHFYFFGYYFIRQFSFHSINADQEWQSEDLPVIKLSISMNFGWSGLSLTLLMRFQFFGFLVCTLIR